MADNTIEAEKWSFLGNRVETLKTRKAHDITLQTLAQTKEPRTHQDIDMYCTQSSDTWSSKYTESDVQGQQSQETRSF